MISLRLRWSFNYMCGLNKFPEDKVHSNSRLQTFRGDLAAGITRNRTVWPSTQTWIIQENPSISLAPRIRLNITNALVAWGKTRRFYTAKYIEVSFRFGWVYLCSWGNYCLRRTILRSSPLKDKSRKLRRKRQGNLRRPSLKPWREEVQKWPVETCHGREVPSWTVYFRVTYRIMQT